MKDVVFTFVGHVTPEAQSCGLPERVMYYDYSKAQNKSDIVAVIERNANLIVAQQGMFVAADPAALHYPDIVDDNRIFVPMRSLAFVSFRYKEMTGEMPLNTREGGQVLASGKEIKKQ